MTDAELRDAAWLELAQTTITYGRWKQQGFTPGHWANAKKLLDQIGATAPPSDVPAPPVLSSPVTFTCQSGAANFFDASGRDCIIKSSGVVEQSANVAANNAVVTLKNYRRAIVEPLQVEATHLQTGPGQNGSGYGFYVFGGDTLYMEQYQPSGPAMAQGLVFATAPRLVQLVSPRFSVMAPVWKKSITPSRPAEVHTDAIQSYGNAGPGTLELYDFDIETCGTCLQVTGTTVVPMGVWKFHRGVFRQVTNSLSDETPFHVTKGAGNGKWATDSAGVTYHARGNTFGVDWVSDPAAWAPGGAWQNTGEAWASV